MKTTLYACCSSIWDRKGTQYDRNCHAAFDSVNAFWQWALARLRAIKCRCEISNIPMVSNNSHRDDRMYQMSIEAIDPRKGYTPGNMRIVCSFLNSANWDKWTKRSDDGPHVWTPELFAQYIGK